MMLALHTGAWLSGSARESRSFNALGQSAGRLRCVIEPGFWHPPTGRAGHGLEHWMCKRRFTQAGGQPRGSRPYTCRYARTVACGGWSNASSRARAFISRNSVRNCSTSARRFCASSSATADAGRSSRTRVDGRRFVRASHIFECWFRSGLDRRRALTPVSESSPVFQVAMNRHSLLEELLDRRMETRQ